MPGFSHSDAIKFVDREERRSVAVDRGKGMLQGYSHIDGVVLDS